MPSFFGLSFSVRCPLVYSIQKSFKTLETRYTTMAGHASRFLLLTLLPVLALGAPGGSSSTSTSAAQGTTVTVTVKEGCGGENSGSTSYVPTSATGSTSSSAPSSTNSAGSSAQPTQNSCGQWVVPGTGNFANKSVFNFAGSSLPAGLSASNYEVDDQNGGAPYNHVFEPANVAVSGGYLNLKVPGGQKPTENTAISSAEVVTNTNMLYGSVRTNAIFSTVPGTCQGKFSRVLPPLLLSCPKLSLESNPQS